MAKFPTVEIGGAPLRIYRTSDIGMLDEAEILHFRGRRDRQVEISGFRVELAEIEVVVRSLTGTDGLLERAGQRPVCGAHARRRPLRGFRSRPGSRQPDRR
jgi:hypothetical protein